VPEINRLKRSAGCFELDFVGREATPEWAMKLGIRLHLAGLSLSNTVAKLERFGVDRCRSTIHNWVQKAGLQPTEGKSPDRVAVDETVIQIDNQRCWLYAAVDPNANEFLHVKLGTAQNLGLSEIFLGEFARNTMSPTPCFSSMARSGSKEPVAATDSDSNTLHTGIGMPSNDYIKNSNTEPTSSPPTSETSSQQPPKPGCLHTYSARISLSEHCRYFEKSGSTRPSRRIEYAPSYNNGNSVMRSLRS
jgi:hypothetical protein